MTRDYRAQNTVLKVSSNLHGKTRDDSRLQSPEHCPEGQLQPAWENTRWLEITEPRTLSWKSAPTCTGKHEITRDYRAQNTVLKVSSNLHGKTQDDSRLQSPEHCPEGQLQPARENTRWLEITEPRTLSWKSAPTCMRKHEMTRDYRAQNTVLKVSSNLHGKTRDDSRLQSPEHCPGGQLQPAWENTRWLEITEPRTLSWKSAPTCTRKHEMTRDYRAQNTVLKVSSNLREKTRDDSRLQSPEHCPEGQLQPTRENTRWLEITEPRTLSWRSAPTCARKHEMTWDYRAQNTVLKVSSNLREKTQDDSRLQSPEHCPESQLQPAWENTRWLEITEPRTLSWRSAPTCARKRDITRDYWRLQSSEHCPEGQLQPTRENMRLLEIIGLRMLSLRSAPTCARKYEITGDYRAQNTVLKVSSNLHEKTRHYSRLLEITELRTLS